MIIPTIYGSILRSNNNIPSLSESRFFILYMCILFCLFDQKTRSAIERNMNTLTGQTSNTANTPFVKRNEMNTGVRIVFCNQSYGLRLEFSQSMVIHLLCFSFKVKSLANNLQVCNLSPQPDLFRVN